MGKFTFSKQSYGSIKVGDAECVTLSNDVFEAFNTDILGLGDIRQNSTKIDCIAAIFDLEGFTQFCGQVEPHLNVPKFLNEFLTWLLNLIRSESKNDELSAESNNQVVLYYELPFFVKFTGDGVLVLWRCRKMSDRDRCNLLVTCYDAVHYHYTQFFENIREEVSCPPPRLRCGVAMGTAYSVGNGDDYVGSCINIAARLQKLSGCSYAINYRGFKRIDHPFFNNGYMAKCRIKVRGISNEEIVLISQKNWDKMNAKDKKDYEHLGILSK